MSKDFFPPRPAVSDVAARDIAAFLYGLETIGRVNVETQPSAIPDEDVTVGIKIISRP
jgi:hypothetical protein